jgi:heptose I phosphotransferase
VGETFWQRLIRGSRRVREQSRWRGFAGSDWAEHIMEVAVTDRFHAKQGRTIGRLVLESGGRRLVVYLKRHYRLPRWRGLLALLRPDTCWSPALQEWEHLEWARAEGLPVPLALAGGEFIGPWGRLQSFLAVEELTGMAPLHEAIPQASSHLAPDEFQRWKKGLIEELVAVVLALHDRDRFHKDLYLCHFYIALDDTKHIPDDWHGRVRLIDLHRLSHHRWTALWWRCKDLGQLLYSSLVPGIAAADRAYFWDTYQQAVRPGWRRRLMRWAIGLRAWNYHRRDRKAG